MTQFQSYLIQGLKEARRRKTLALAKLLSIDLEKRSPDLFIISPQNKYISIDEIRDLKRHLFQKPIKDKFKFILIESAEKLTIEAQNALLKILEEPPPHAIVVLETSDKSHLLPTITSRTIIQRAPTPSTRETQKVNFWQQDTLSLLKKIAKVEDPTAYLDEQIINLYKHLLQKPKIGESQNLPKIIEACAQTKAMIEANVNPKFALFNLVFNIKLKS